jgi:hypothetical protein
MIKEGNFTPAAKAKTPSPDPGMDKAEVKKEKASPVRQREEAAPKADSAELLKKWPGFIQEIKSRGKIKLRTYLSMAKPVKAESGVILLSYEKEDVFSKEALEAPSNKADVEAVASQYFGMPIKVKCIISGEKEQEEQDDIVKAAVEIVGTDKVEVVEEE